MFDVHQTVAQLAKLPDSALQQFAAMHKADPYTLALAVSESNRRKQMRAAQTGQQPGPDGPVVDQTIAGMNPDVPDVQQTPSYLQGLAQQPRVQQPQQQQQLPPGPNQQNAGSGIAQIPSSPMNMAGGGLVSFAGAEGSWVNDSPAAPAMTRAGHFVREYAPRLHPLSPDNPLTYPARTFVMNPLYKHVIRPFAEGVAPELFSDSATPRGTLDLEKQWSPDAAAKLAAEEPPPPVPEIETAPEAGLGALALPSSADTSEYQKMIAANDAAFKERMETWKKEKAGQGEAMAGMEALLQKQRAGNKEDMEHAKGVALLQAGATIASTPGDLLSAAGEGVKAALPGYEAARRDIKKAEDAQDEREMVVKELRRAEKRGDADKVMELTAQRDQLDQTIRLHAADSVDRFNLAKMQIGAQERIASTRYSGSIDRYLSQLSERQQAKFLQQANLNFKQMLESDPRMLSEQDPNVVAQIRQQLWDAAQQSALDQIGSTYDPQMSYRGMAPATPTR